MSLGPNANNASDPNPEQTVALTLTLPTNIDGLLTTAQQRHIESFKADFVRGPLPFLEAVDASIDEAVKSRSQPAP